VVNEIPRSRKELKNIYHKPIHIREANHSQDEENAVKCQKEQENPELKKLMLEKRFLLPKSWKNVAR